MQQEQGTQESPQHESATTAEKTIVMTGASRGIGRIAVTHLRTLQPGAHLILVARGDISDLVDELQSIAGGSVTVVHADLSSLQSLADATDAIADLIRAKGLPPIGTLVCNAGLQHTSALMKTIDGFESTIAVNVLANHVLIRRLRDHMTPDARLVVTVSDTHFGDFRHNLGMVPGPRWQPMEKLCRVGAFDNAASTKAGRTAYSTSKLAAIYLIHEYARRMPSTWTVVGYNPGFVAGTDLARDADVFSRFAMRRVLPVVARMGLGTSLSEAGQSLAEAALGAIDAPSGGYIDRTKVARSSPESYDRIRERQVWDAVETLTTEYLPSTADTDRSPHAHNRHHRSQ